MAECGRKPHVLLIYRRMIPSIRLCGHCQMEYLAGQGQAAYRAVQEMRLKNDDLNWADVVLLGRLDSWYERKLTEALHKAGKYLIYIIDDDLLCVPPEISSAAYFNQSEIQKNIRMMMAMSNAIVSPSPLLLKKYATDGKRAIQIEEPAIDPVPYRAHDSKAPVKIGFAGSVDRTGDLENILKDALIAVKRQYGERVQFEFFGAIPSFAKELDAKCIPYCDSYDEYRRTLNELQWDIGLAPMLDTPFHACKHYNKFVEYGAAGIVGVFSDVQPYVRLQALCSQAILCENTSDAWYAAISSLIEAPEKREAQRRMVSDLASDAMSVRAGAMDVARRLAEIDMPSNKDCTWRGNLSLLKVGGAFMRVKGAVQRHGWRLPMVVLKKMKLILSRED